MRCTEDNSLGTCNLIDYPNGPTCRASAEGNGPNNYVWIAHPHGEISRYSYLQQNNVPASLVEGGPIAAGTFLGFEGDIGFAGGPHLHIEVARHVARSGLLFGATGFLNVFDNDGGFDILNRVPVFCQIGFVEGGTPETTVTCDSACGNDIATFRGSVDGLRYDQVSDTAVVQNLTVEADEGYTVRAGA